MTTTYADALGKHDITIPAHIEAELEVPVLTGVQRQGDVGIFPIRQATLRGSAPVPRAGIQVVRGEATGNTHWLDADGPVTFAPAPQDGRLLLGELIVPAGATAWITHSDEHGSNAIGPGVYALHGKRELRDEITRVQD